MGRSPPNIVGSKSPIARSSIFVSPLPVLIVVPFRKQLVAFPFAQPFPTALPLFPQFAEAGSVFDMLPSAANARIAPIFMVLRRVRCIPRFKSSASRIIVLSTFPWGTLCGERLQISRRLSLARPSSMILPSSNRSRTTSARSRRSIQGESALRARDTNSTRPP